MSFDRCNLRNIPGCVSSSHSSRGGRWVRRASKADTQSGLARSRASVGCIVFRHYRFPSFFSSSLSDFARPGRLRPRVRRSVWPLGNWPHNYGSLHNDTRSVGGPRRLGFWSGSTVSCSRVYRRVWGVLIVPEAFRTIGFPFRRGSIAGRESRRSFGGGRISPFFTRWRFCPVSLRPSPVRGLRSRRWRKSPSL